MFGATIQTTPTGGNSPNSVITTDLNSDGFFDLITANQGGSNISVMLGQAAGKFGNGTTYTVGTESVLCCDWRSERRLAAGLGQLERRHRQPERDPQPV
ncbi:MAG: VCBS repeat-containing protein [Polyangia bacterium]